jgi:hypothetical protein
VRAPQAKDYGDPPALIKSFQVDDNAEYTQKHTNKNEGSLFQKQEGKSIYVSIPEEQHI